MRHTAAPFLLTTLKKAPPPAHVYVELLVESKGNILLAFLLPKEQLNFKIGNELRLHYVLQPAGHFNERL